MSAVKRLGVLVGCLCLLLGAANSAKAQTYEVQQLVLDWQKLEQEKQLLSDLYKGYEILSSGYSAIRDLSKGSFDLHKAFLEGLLVVSPAVRNYKRVADIITLQLQIAASYQAAWSRFRQDPHFTPDELGMMANLYSGFFDQTVNNLSTLAMLLTDGEMRASDAERLRQIDALYRDMQGKWVSIQSFNNRTALLSLQRSADASDYETVKQWYGLNN